SLTFESDAFWMLDARSLMLDGAMIPYRRILLSSILHPPSSLALKGSGLDGSADSLVRVGDCCNDVTI
ncbi:MAG TPA: hypothetical protein VFB72_17310, partial [Verrucomicrobiae bacterium]|nr:hypothetical protein [Verrucomicrobiae bacterium]